MHHDMGQQTRREVLDRRRCSYAGAGAEFQHQLVDGLVIPQLANLARRGSTRSGSLLRQRIPIRGGWPCRPPEWDSAYADSEPVVLTIDGCLLRFRFSG